MKHHQWFFNSLILLGLFSLINSELSRAGVFNIPRFVTQGSFAAGIEPELITSSGAGVGINARYTYGIAELSNLFAIIGTGSGPREFRVGAGLTFDVFPDLEKQPGIGIAVQALYGVRPTGSGIELTTTPYIHKSFKPAGIVPVDPFLAIPVGVRLRSNNVYDVISTLAVGSQFQHNEHFSSLIELGLGLSSSETYISGGVIYYP